MFWKKNDKREEEFEIMISSLLSTMFENFTIEEYLKEFIDILSKLSWLGISKKSLIFLMNSKKELILVAQNDFEVKETKTVKKIKLETACFKEIIKTNNVTFCNSETSPLRKLTSIDYYSIPIIVENKMIGIMIVYVLLKENKLYFMNMLSSIISTILGKKIVEERIKINTYEAEHIQKELLNKLVTASEFRDDDTGNHIKRVTEYSVLLAKKLNLPKKQIKLLQASIALHDVGKIAISDSVLLKPGRLTAEEFEAIKKHTTIGGELLVGKGEYLSIAREVALTHHEKWNGKGYPNGLKETEIPISGRICAVADVFDALTSIRPYKKAWSVERAFDLIKSEAGKHFDPVIAKTFLGLKDEVILIKSLYRDEIDTSEELLLMSFNDNNAWIKWNDKLYTGVNSVDNQHRYLINLTNKFYHALKKENSIFTILDTLRELQEYTDVHFRDEEKVMANYQIPDLKEHIKMHHDFEKRLDDFATELKNNPFIIAFDILDFLKAWLINHILYEDTKIKKYL